VNVELYIRCDQCGHAGDAGLPEASAAPGFLACPNCGALITNVDVSPMAAWIDRQVSRRSSLPSRKQDASRSDGAVSKDGICAEMAAAAVLAPAAFGQWMQSVEIGGGNRGRDLPESMTGLDRPVEIKQTKYRSAATGYLIVRPPRWTPGAMLIRYLDNSYYVLAIGGPSAFRISGWVDRDGLIQRGVLNPVPRTGRQRECWGVHWKQLNAMESLACRIAAGAK